MKYIAKTKNLLEFPANLNESSIKILECLIENKNPVSTKELVKHCNVSSRMIQYNLEKLLNNKPPLVSKASDLKDMRLQRYTLNPNLNERMNEIRNIINFSQSKFNR